MKALKKGILKRAVWPMVVLALLFSGMLMSRANSATWDSVADTSWYDPIYTSFVIDTPEKLAGVAKLVNSGAIVMNNATGNGVPVDGFYDKILEVDRNLLLDGRRWIPIGTEEYPFKGTLIAKEGSVFQISGMELTGSEPYAGLVGKMESATVGGFEFLNNGVIQISTSGRDHYVGAAVGKMTGTSIVYDITNHIAMDVEASGSGRAYVGGIVGSGEGTIANSINRGFLDVQGLDAQAGGITGYVDQAGMIIKKVQNHGSLDVRTNGSRDVYAGGIVGYATGNLYVHDEATPVQNHGAVTGADGRFVYAGGIIGKVERDITLSDSTDNHGAVTIQAPNGLGTYAGALAGAVTGEQSNPAYYVSFTNTAAVTNHGGSNVYTGGLMGWVNSTLMWQHSFTNAVSITATGSSHVYTGGVLGKADKDTTFNGELKNTGAIVVHGSQQPGQLDEAFTGGFIGAAETRIFLNATAPQAYENRGTLTVTGDNGLYTGGIMANRAYTGGALTLGNVSSAADLTVTGTDKIYTGGYIGFVPAEGVDKNMNQTSFANKITVTASQAAQGASVATGGIVGYYVDQTGTGVIADPSFSGHLQAVGGREYVYTGGIVGQMEAGKVSKAAVGGTPADFASLTSDSVLGGIVGKLNGTIVDSTAVHVKLKGTTVGAAMGGAVGVAQGELTGITVGSTQAGSSLTSVILEADTSLTGSTNDEITAGGLVGFNNGPFEIKSSLSTRVELLTVAGRTGYRLGGVAGYLTSAAVVGEAGTPVRVQDLLIQQNAADSIVGGAIGLNESAHVHMDATRIEIRVPAANGRAGGIVGLQNVITGVIPAEAPAGITAASIKLVATGNNLLIGGMFGENQQDAPVSLAREVQITASGSHNRIGGSVGFNTGNLYEHQVHALNMTVTGTHAEVGGIVGRSDRRDGSAQTPAIIRSELHGGELPTLTVSGANSFMGGTVGFARYTDIQTPKVTAVTPDYVILQGRATPIAAGGIAGRMEEGRILGDTFRMNLENLLLTTTAAAPDAYVGGFVGYNHLTTLEKLVAEQVTLNVSGQRTQAGGMAGYNKGVAGGAVISTIYMEKLAIRANSSASSSIVGGFVGKNDIRDGDPTGTPASTASSIQNSRYTGTLTVLAPSSVTGGMVGENHTLIANNSIVDKVTVISRGNESIVGGLVGSHTQTAALYYTYTNAALTVEGQFTLAGGLVGENRGRILSSYVDQEVTGSAYGTLARPVFLGGLIGRNHGIIEKSYSTAKVTSNGVFSRVGGLVGEQVDGSITNSYAGREVAAVQDKSYAGGLMGRFVAGTVTNSYSAAQVKGTNGAFAGGFVGLYDHSSKDPLFRNYYIKDGAAGINQDLPDFADGTYRWMNAHARLSTLQAAALRDRSSFPGLSGWDFTGVWKYGSPNAEYLYPELIRTANTGSGNVNTVNANINWYMRDKDALVFDIKSEAELAGLAALVNGTVPGMLPYNFEGRTLRVLNPIHIQSTQWVPIGFEESVAFQGTFQGGQHLIDGLTVLPDYRYSGLFGVIGEQGAVEQVKLEPVVVDGQAYTGVLVGYNKGRIAGVTLKLPKDSEIRGVTVGGLAGKNDGSWTGITLVMDGDSYIVGKGDQAVVGGLVGENNTAVSGAMFQVTDAKGQLKAAGSHAIVGGVVGKQAGDFQDVNLEVNYKVSLVGQSAVAGGLVGQYTDGLLEKATIRYHAGSVEAQGTSSVLGGAVGRSDSGQLMKDVTVTSVGTGTVLRGNGTTGGLVGMKQGNGLAQFELETVLVEKLTLANANATGSSVTMGGIVGQLSEASVQDARFTGKLTAAQDQVTAGGIVGRMQDSIVFHAEAGPDLTVEASSGVNAVGGIAGSVASSAPNREFDYGFHVPLYHGIYHGVAHTDIIQVTALNPAADLYVGGITGRNEGASLYFAKASADMQVKGARRAAVGGIAGYHSGILVNSSAHQGITVGTTSINMVGGIIGQADGGEIHFTKHIPADGKSIQVTTAVTRPGVLPAIYTGGFVGQADRTLVKNSYTKLSVQVTDTNPENDIYAGGFAGILGDRATGIGSMEQVYATGMVKVNGKVGSSAGGFAGSIDRYTITQAYAAGNVSNTAFDMRTGGFAGAVERFAEIQSAYAIPSMVSTKGTNQATRAYTGGFTGYNDGKLEAVFAGGMELEVTLTGANVYNGALVGYQFRDGRLAHATFIGSRSAVGYELGSTTATAAVATAPQGFAPERWVLEPDTSFLTNAAGTELELHNVQHFNASVKLSNLDGLAYYQLFNRSATDAFVGSYGLKTDLDLEKEHWLPYDSFKGSFNGNGHTITGIRLTAPTSAASYGFMAENFGSLINLTLVKPQLEGHGILGSAVGINHAGGEIRQVKVVGAVLQGGDATTAAGGLAGQNEGVIESSYTGGVITAGAGQTARIAVGGLVGLNQETGVIRGSFSYMDVAATGTEVMAGGLAGSNEGLLETGYATGRVKAYAPNEGAGKTWAGGIVGSMAKGTLSGMYAAGEVTASVNGKLLPGQTYFGGIAGQKMAPAAINGSTYNHQMLKLQAGYYDHAGKRMTGSTSGAVGMTAKSLSSGLPTGLSSASWVTASGFYPQLKEFQGTTASRLSTAAVILHEKDRINRMRQGFDLSREQSLEWNAVQGDVLITAGTTFTRGTLQAETSTATIAVTAAGETRMFSLNTPALRYQETAVAPISMGERRFVGETTVALGTSEPGGAIYYTVDGSVPTDGSLLYSQPIRITGNTTIKAITITEDKEHSAEFVGEWKRVAAAPIVSSGSERIFTGEAVVELAVMESQGTIYYTLDGSEPSRHSLVYTGPIRIAKDTMLKAITAGDQMENSRTMVEVFQVKRAAVSNGGGGGFVFLPVAPAVPQAPAIGAQIGRTVQDLKADAPITVAKNSKLSLVVPAGKTIYYTTDGSAPTKKSKVYTGEILVTGSMTIKAITEDSDEVTTIRYEVANADYSIRKDAASVKYAAGYPNQTFQPDRAMSRYEIIASLAPLLNKEDVTVGTQLSDVSGDYENLVAFFGSAGLVQGYPDGSFRGSNGLTRSEFVVVLSRVLKLDITEPGVTLLTDLRGHWSEKYVNAFTKAGYVKGYPDGTFKPGKEITRAEAIVLINKIMGKSKQNRPTTFIDLPLTHWAYEEIMAAVE